MKLVVFGCRVSASLVWARAEAHVSKRQGASVSRPTQTSWQECCRCFWSSTTNTHRWDSRDAQSAATASQSAYVNIKTRMLFQLQWSGSPLRWSVWASAEIMAPAAVQKVKNRNDRKLIVLTYLLNEYLNLKKTLISSLIRLCFFCTKHLITTIVCFSLKFSICFMRI